MCTHAGFLHENWIFMRKNGIIFDFGFRPRKISKKVEKIPKNLAKIIPNPPQTRPGPVWGILETLLKPSKTHPDGLKTPSNMAKTPPRCSQDAS